MREIAMAIPEYPNPRERRKTRYSLFSLPR
jgi:hypothetical protein